MFKEIFRFELRQQLREPLLWCFVALFFIGAGALLSSPAVKIGSAVGNVHVNAPMVVANLAVAFAFLATLFVVVFVSRALLRDFDQNTAETLFSTPVSRSAYLGGRAGAAFAVVLGLILASLLGAYLGTFMPWIDAARLGPHTTTPWLWTLGVILIPDALFVTALLFALSALTRSLTATFVGVIALVVLRTVASILTEGLDDHTLAALLDPYGAQALGAATRYWTAHAYNTRLPPLDGVLQGNRLLWLGVSMVLFALGVFLFRSQREGLQWRWPWQRRGHAKTAPAAPVALPQVHPARDAAAQCRQMLAVFRLDLRNTLRGALFTIMLLLSLAILAVVLYASGKAYGTPLYPVTHSMLSSIRGAFSLFLMIVLAFYAGELIWRERTLNAHLIGDATPVPGWTLLAGKALVLVALTWIFLAVGAAATIGFQLSRGYTHLQPGLYLSGLLLTSITFILFGVLALVLQALSNNRYVGYSLFIAAMLGNMAMGFLDLDQNLYQYANRPALPYSDLNGYGHFLAGSLWFALYWALFAVILLVLARLFHKRGSDQGHRWRSAWRRLHQRPLQLTLAATVVAFVACGSWIYYNTNVRNDYISSDQNKQDRADYEKLYGKYLDAPQPRITATTAHVDIYPYRRTLHLHVEYTLVNKHAKPIDRLYVNWRGQLDPSHLEFAPHTTVKNDKRLGFSIYKLEQPLAPGASMKFSFDLDYAPKGFKNNPGGMDYLLVHNGTFFNNRRLFPSFGYNRDFQLTDKSDRRKYHLPEEPRSIPLSEDPAKRANTYMANDADWIKLDSIVSTAGDQVAIAPGKLIRQWHKDGRNYYEYRTEAPILNFYTYLSGKWKVKRSRWHDVDISVWYNPAHAWNVDDMIASARDSLSYYTGHYTPYQFKYLRIIEIPNYHGFAQSYAGTIAFSEGIGFVADLRDKSNIDYPYYVTAHEIAHQWWAHQVIGANMQGATMLSESLAQYSALMVLKQKYGANAMRKFLKYELDKYLVGRLMDQHETPLGKVEGQAYIRYQKASAIFYALQDYIGENVIDGILKQFAEDKGFQQPPYTTSRELIEALKAGTDPKWHPLIDDSFWKITLYDNRVVSASAKKLADGKYQVKIKLHAAKYYADSDGKQHEAPMHLPLEIGVFAQAPDGIEGHEQVLYLAKRKIANGDSTLTLTVDGKPWEVGVDPYNELVDRNTNDNRKRVSYP